MDSPRVKQHDRPSAVITSFLAVLFILHCIGSVNVLLQLSQYPILHSLYIFNLTMFILPFVLIHVFSVLYFVGESGLDPSLPFVVIIYCLTFFKLDLESNDVAYFCANVENITVKILNYFLSILLFTCFAVSVPIISIVWMLREYRQGPLFEIASIYQIIVMLMNTIIHLITLSLDDDKSYAQSIQFNVFIFCIAINVLYLLICVHLYCKYTLESAGSLLVFSISTELLLLFVMIFITFTINFYEQVQIFKAVLFINYIFLNIPGLTSYLVHQYNEWVAINTWMNPNHKIVDRLYCYLHLLLYHKDTQNIYHETSALLNAHNENNVDADNTKLAPVHPKYSIQCFKTLIDFIEMDGKQKYQHIRELLAYYDDFGGNGSTFRQWCSGIAWWIHCVSTCVALVYPAVCLVIFFTVPSDIHDAERYVVHVFFVVLTCVYIGYCGVFVMRVRRECQSSVKHFSVIANAMWIERRLNWQIQESVQMLDMMEYVKVIAQCMQMDIGLIILSFLYQPHTQ